MDIDSIKTAYAAYAKEYAVSAKDVYDAYDKFQNALQALGCTEEELGPTRQHLARICRLCGVTKKESVQ